MNTGDETAWNDEMNSISPENRGTVEPSENTGQKNCVAEEPSGATGHSGGVTEEPADGGVSAWAFLTALIRCVLPLLVQLAAAFVVSAVVQLYFPDSAPAGDATLLTAMCDGAAIPILLYMYLKDRRKEKKQAVEKREQALSMEAAVLSGTAAGGIPAGEREMAEKRGKRKKRTAAFYLTAFLTGMAMSVGYSLLMSALHLDRYFSNATQETMLSSPAAVQLAGLCLIAPVTEELVFRGLFYGRLKTYIPGRVAMLTTAPIFALEHGNVIQMLYAFPMGLVLAVFYDRADSVSGSIACHIGANLISVLINIAAG